MAEKSDSVDMLLSHIELMLVASLLGQRNIIGLEGVEGDTRVVSSPAQREREAAQSLLARQLASIGPNGTPRIDRRVVNAVRICAYPQRVIIAQQLTDDQHNNVTLAYLTDSTSVVLRLVGVNKYRLSLYTKAADALIAFERLWMNDKMFSPSPNIALVVNDDVLMTVRNSVLNHDIQAAQQALNQAGVNSLAANALTHFLGKPHSFVAIQGIHLADAQLKVRSASVLQNGTSAWLMAETPDSASTAHRCALSTVSSEGVHQFIQRLMAS